MVQTGREGAGLPNRTSSTVPFVSRTSRCQYCNTDPSVNRKQLDERDVKDFRMNNHRVPTKEKETTFWTGLSCSEIQEGYDRTTVVHRH